MAFSWSLQNTQSYEMAVLRDGRTAFNYLHEGQVHAVLLPCCKPGGNTAKLCRYLTYLDLNNITSRIRDFLTLKWQIKHRNECEETGENIFTCHHNGVGGNQVKYRNKFCLS